MAVTEWQVAFAILNAISSRETHTLRTFFP